MLSSSPLSYLLLLLFVAVVQIFGSVVGIKVLNLVTNRVARTVGGAESAERFLAVALYQVCLFTPLIINQCDLTFVHVCMYVCRGCPK